MKFAPLLACGLLLGAALPAAAAERASLSYADLDFSKPADVATFNARLDAVVKKACAGNNTVQLDGARRVTCRASVRERALASLPEDSRVAVTGAKSPPQEWAAR
jgi:UrcA family protein